MLVDFDPMNWKQMLAYVTGSVDEELLARNEYLVTENRILRHQIKGRVRLTDPEQYQLGRGSRKVGAKSPRRNRPDCATRNHSGVAPTVDRQEV